MALLALFAGGCGGSGGGPTVPWDYQVVSKSSNPTLKLGESALFEIQVRNTGTQNWLKINTSQTPVSLGTWQPQDRTPSFTEGDGWWAPDRVALVEASVKPGETGTFIFYYAVPQAEPLGLHQEFFNLVADNAAWFPDHEIHWDITVVTP